MTQKRLEQYRALRSEVIALELRIAELRCRPPDIVSDSVKASSPFFPYTEHSVAIQGYSPQQQARLDRLATRLIARRDRLIGEIEAIDSFVECIGDSVTRQIIDLRYIQGKSWRTVSDMVYGRVDRESTARMRLKSFFRKK